MESSPGLLDDCLKLLRGDSDEQKLAGLFIATQLCNGVHRDAVVQVYHALGSKFLDRLLFTGLGRGSEVKAVESRETYLRLSLSIMSAFCQVPEVASSEDMVSKLPDLLEVISVTSDPVNLQECYEMIWMVIHSSEDGLTRLYESGVIPVLASRISVLSDGSSVMELAVKLLHFICTKLPINVMINKYQSEISCLVESVARQFGELHTALKFDALHLLTCILSSESATELYDLKTKSNAIWASNIHIGIVAVLQNRVASPLKIQALALADSTINIVGEKWLVDPNHLLHKPDQLPLDKCLLLVLESARIEVAVLLNELAYLKYGASTSSPSIEIVTEKQKNMAVLFSLLEKVIKLLSEFAEADLKGATFNDTTAMRAIMGLDQTMDLLLDFLNDAKDHDQRKGNDLLAAVRLLGSYLAEVPFSLQKKVDDLLEYILSIEGDDEQSPFYAVCFMLPMLCQQTSGLKECRKLLSFGGHKIVVDCLVKAVGPVGHIVDDHGTGFLACNIILNLLLNRKKVNTEWDESYVFLLLHALALWAGKTDDPSIIMMASSICTLLFDLTSEESLLKLANFDENTLLSLSQLIARSWDASLQAKARNDVGEDRDFFEIIKKGYRRWKTRFPYVRKAVEGSGRVKCSAFRGKN